MNWKKFLLTFAAVFVAATLLGFVIHVLILGEDYRSLGHLYRDQSLLPFLLLGNLAFALAFAWLYAKGGAGKTVARPRAALRLCSVGPLGRALLLDTVFGGAIAGKPCP